MQFGQSLCALARRLQRTSRQYIHFLALWRESTRLLHSIRYFWGGFCLTVAARAVGFSPFATKWSSPLFWIFTNNLSLLPAPLQPWQKQQLRLGLRTNKSPALVAQLRSSLSTHQSSVSGGNLLPRFTVFSLAPTWTAAERGRSLTWGIVGRSPSPWGCRWASGHRRSTTW